MSCSEASAWETWPSPNPPSKQAKTLEALKAALPPREFAALSSWLTTFFPFQLQWLLDFSRFAVALKSRQIGQSHTTAAATVLWAAFLGETTTIVSVGEREAVEVLDKAQAHAVALCRLGSKWAKVRRRGNELAFPHSGGRVVAVPSSSGGRSFSGNTFLDEFAYVEDPDAIWDAAAGSALHGFRMRVASTPNGVGNAFHKLWSDPKAHAGWNRHLFPLDRALAEGMNVNLDDCRKLSKGDDRIYAQLFSCAFLDGNDQYIPTSLVDACRVPDTYCYEGENFAGLDIGRTADLTVLYIVRRDPLGVRWVQRYERRKRTSPQDLKSLVAMAFEHPYRCRRLVVDATGMGAFPAAEFQQVYGESRVEALAFTQQSKEDLATGLYQALAAKTIRFNADDEALRNDLLALRRIVTKAGNISYDAPHTDAGHADNAWALAMALHASAAPLGYRIAD
jgi:phage FluMu gp28-like protein